MFAARYFAPRYWNRKYWGKGSLAGTYSLVVAQGSFSVTGQVVGLRAARVIAAAQGGYILTGWAVTFAYCTPTASRTFIVLSDTRVCTPASESRTFTPND